MRLGTVPQLPVYQRRMRVSDDNPIVFIVSAHLPADTSERFSGLPSVMEWKRANVLCKRRLKSAVGGGR